MKLLIRIGVFALALAALAFVKVKYFTKDVPAMGQPTGAGGNGAPPSVGVLGYVMRSEKLDNKIFATGTIISSEVVDLKPEVAGKIVQMNIREGPVRWQL